VPHHVASVSSLYDLRVFHCRLGVVDIFYLAVCVYWIMSNMAVVITASVVGNGT